MRCLAKRAEDRYQSAADVLQRLDAIAPAAAGPAVRRRSGRPLVAGGLAVLALVALAMVVLTKRTMRAPRGGLVLRQATFRQGVQQSPAWSPDGRQLAFTGDAGPVRKIFVQRADSGEATQLTDGPFDDLQPAWSPDGRTIAFVRAQRPGVRLEPGDVFAQYDSGDVWIVDVATRRAAPLVANGFNPAYSPRGDRIAVDASWAGPRRIWVVDVQGHNPEQVTADSSEAVTHVRPRWSPDGREIVFLNIERTNFNIRVANLATHRTGWVTRGSFQDLGPVWTPDGKVIFSSARGGGMNLWRVGVTSEGTAAGAPRQITTGGGQDVDPAVAPDGRRIAFAILRQNADLWRLPVSAATGRPTGPPEPLIATTREDSRGAWSPDGARIAFNSDRAGPMNIWLYALADGATRQITQGAGGDYQPNWSPDGTRLAFFSSRAGNVDIWTVALASGALSQLTHGASIDVNPFFSPDGRHIAYQSDESGRLEVWVMNADGSEPRQLTTVGVGGHFLRWTPDGRGVVFRCPCGGKPQLLEVPVTGGAPEPQWEMSGGAHVSFSPDHARIMDVVGHKVLWVSPRGGKAEKVFGFDDPEVRIDYPVWSPDGKWVLFDRFRPEGGDVWVIENVD
jgi:Tol biopolymer transport system component